MRHDSSTVCHLETQAVSRGLAMFGVSGSIAIPTAVCRPGVSFLDASANWGRGGPASLSSSQDLFFF